MDLWCRRQNTKPWNALGRSVDDETRSSISVSSVINVVYSMKSPSKTFSRVLSQVSKLKSLRCGCCTAEARAWISSSPSSLAPTTKDTQACHESWRGTRIEYLKYSTCTAPNSAPTGYRLQATGGLSYTLTKRSGRRKPHSFCQEKKSHYSQKHTVLMLECVKAELFTEPFSFGAEKRSRGTSTPTSNYPLTSVLQLTFKIKAQTLKVGGFLLCSYCVANVTQE